jgi:cell division septation protein DedD
MPAAFANPAGMDAAAESPATEPAQLAASLADTTTPDAADSPDMAAADVASLENLAPTAAGPAVSTAAAASETAVVALAEPEPAAAASSPAAAAAAPSGEWVINLASYTYKSTAQRKLALFQSKGVTGEIERIIVNDKPLYRIRVTGFESSRSARASIPALQETLGLEGAWIARR